MGNENGAHHVCAEVAQALVDVGFTIPARASPCRVGEARGRTNHGDLAQTPVTRTGATRTLARRTAHLAGLLQASLHPGIRRTCQPSGDLTPGLPGPRRVRSTFPPGLRGIGRLRQDSEALSFATHVPDGAT